MVLHVHEGLCISIFTLLVHVSSTPRDRNDVPRPNTCLFAVGKAPGDFKNQANSKVRAKNPPVAIHETADPKQCKFLCTLNKNCWFIEVRREKRKCYFYDKHSTVVRGGQSMIFWWTSCPIPDSCKILPHRCKGFWLLRENVSLSGPQVIKTITNIQDARRCRTECLSIPMCDSINFRDINPDDSLDGGYCELLYFSPHNRSYIRTDDSASYEWYCCPHSDDDLPKDCRNQRGKCRGKWQPKPRQRLAVNGSIGQVHTLSKFDCMSFCDKNPYCNSVYFNQREAKCILRGEDSNFISRCVNFNASADTLRDWFIYEWTCCDRRQDPIQIDQSVSGELDARCVCLNATSVGRSIIATDGCTRPLTKYNVTIDSPLAAFWLAEDREVTVNGRTWTRIFNGETHLWVARPIAEMDRCPKHRCDIYSTVIDKNAECPRIIPRSEWYARPPVHNITNFMSTPFNDIILDTVCPEMGCYSKLSCADYMRQFQYVHQIHQGLTDIAYNFVVGEDGNVYEGRGPNVTGAHTYGWNMASEGVAVIGWFENRVPNIASLRATRLLLRCMVSRSETTKAYQVLAHRDVRPSKVPGQLLYELLPNWQHYYRTMLPPGPDCEFKFLTERVIIILFILTFAALVILIFIVFIHCVFQLRFRKTKVDFYDVRLLN